LKFEHIDNEEKEEELKLFLLGEKLHIFSPRKKEIETGKKFSFIASFLLPSPSSLSSFMVKFLMLESLSKHPTDRQTRACCLTVKRNFSSSADLFFRGKPTKVSSFRLLFLHTIALANVGIVQLLLFFKLGII
jgi:hypothetical protein